MYEFRRERPVAYANAMPLSCAREQQTPRVEQGSRHIVTVSAEAAGRLYVESLQHYRLTIAVSCLVQPMAGDRVCVIADGRCLVITEILSRQQTDTAMTLECRSAHLRIVAPEIELHGRKRLTLKSPDFSLLTRSSRWVAKTLHQVSQCLFVRSQHASRQVEGTDTLQARHIRQEAQQSLVMQGEMASLKASAVLKIDGGQVHVG